jgi:hypothetical protein
MNRKEERMARLFVSDERLRGLVERLTPLLLAAGSVNRLCELINQSLSGDDGAKRKMLYPNRLHALFSGEPTRALNEASVKLIQRSLERPPLSDPSFQEQGARLLVEMRARMKEEWSHRGSNEQLVADVANDAGVPLAVAAVALRDLDLSAAFPGRPFKAERPPQAMPDSPLQVTVGLVEALSNLKSDDLISYGTTLKPILEHIILLSNKYLRMIKAADES